MEPPQPASRSYRAVVFAVFFVVVGVGTWLALQLLAYYAGGEEQAVEWLEAALDSFNEFLDEF